MPISYASFIFCPSSWETTKFYLGSLNQEFSIILEMQVPFDNSSIAVDNIRLTNCFPESRSYECTESMFRCNNGSCLKREHVCDLTADCADGEDETGDCGELELVKNIKESVRTYYVHHCTPAVNQH